MTNVLTFASQLFNSVDVFSDTITVDVTGARYHGDTEALTGSSPVNSPDELAEWLMRHRPSITGHGEYVLLARTTQGTVTAQAVTGSGGWWQ